MYSIILMLIILNGCLVICDPCNTFKTCGKCIGQPLKCVWCSAKNHDGPRCRSNSIRSDWCEDTTYDPKTEPPIEIKNVEFMTDIDDKTIQFRPQEITVTVRIGDPVSFNMSYKPAKDYPLDIYYLMDGTYTMEQHKNTLVARANETYITLQAITNNVRFGVGSYVEKPALPFADPAKPANSFKNYLSLTDDIDQFVEIVKKINMTGNNDLPEASLDALMQVMVCEDIKWNLDQARRIIILSTDSTYHSAGDGKIVGTTRPNDMKCHLKGNEYDPEKALTFDYPSVSQINKVASEKQIKIMFAVADADQRYTSLEAKDVYDMLSTKVAGSVSVKLTDGLVDMIKTGYLELVQDLKIVRSVMPSIDLTLEPPCDVTSQCKVKHDESYDMLATLKVDSCPSDDEFIHYLQIGPSSLNERLTVKVNAYCQCDCEKDGRGDRDSPTCSNFGTYQCGVCKCNDNRYGETCECEGSSTQELDFEKCKMNKNDTDPCSGRGKCTCGGKCECDADIYGSFCQFGKYNCQFFENKLCGGNGKCVNDTCVCDGGWTGDACNCTTSQSECFGANSQICSGKGECVCGQCQCTAKDSKNNRYTGPYCNWCYDCQDARCKELEPFVACYHSNMLDNTTHTCDEKFKHTSPYNVKVLNQNASEFLIPDSFRCDKTLEDGSTIVFMYADQSNSTLILIQKEKVIPPVANIWIAVGSSIGVILLIGLLTVLAWKILIDLRDAREYENFSKKSAAEGFDIGLTENPTYQPATVNFLNPAYKDGKQES